MSDKYIASNAVETIISLIKLKQNDQIDQIRRLEFVRKILDFLDFRFFYVREKVPEGPTGSFVWIGKIQIHNPAEKIESKFSQEKNL